MKSYMGLTNVEAEPMNRLDYNELRGWDLPDDEDGTDDGYLILSHGESNTEKYNGYVRWLTKNQFDIDFKEDYAMSFSDALLRLKFGNLLSREGWNGKKMFIFLVDGSTFKVNRAPLDKIFEEGTEINYLPHIDMRTADGSIVPWLASQSDILSNDWSIVKI